MTAWILHVVGSLLCICAVGLASCGIVTLIAIARVRNEMRKWNDL